MLILISPAKKLNTANFSLKEYSQPMFIEDAEKLIAVMRKHTPKQLSKLMNISASLAELNFERYSKWKKEHKLEASKQAVYMFDGEVYSGLDAASFSKKEVSYAQEKLRILSGLYGLLRPLDLIHPYRLEMGTKLKIGRKGNLYEFWGDKIVDEINNLQLKDEGPIVNLASNEYFKVVNKKKLQAEVVTPVFKDWSNGKYKTVMVYAKKARGMMASYIIKNQVKNKEALLAFDTAGYYYNDVLSSANELVFCRDQNNL